MPPLLEKIVLRRCRVGGTDIYHENVMKRGALGQLYLLLFGTPNLGNFSNGIYLNRVLRQGGFRTVLDAGCGDGTFSFYTALKCPKCSVTGMDIGEQGLHTSESTLDVCSRIGKKLGLGNLEFRKTDLRELSEEEKYDLVFSFDVLEHIKENRKVLENFYRALVRGGRLLVRIPTRRQERILSAKFTAEHEKWAAIEHVGQHYEMRDLYADLRTIGFEIISAGYTNGYWGKLSFELLEAMKYYKLPEPLVFGLIPALKLLRLIDAAAQPKQGNGLLMLCRK
ncbi:MAG TPA: class I SAM-dependent methyltransferase [Dissulfurispiraceae bacterium]